LMIERIAAMLTAPIGATLEPRATALENGEVIRAAVDRPGRDGAAGAHPP
jgi:hypothetical protein